MTDLLPTSKLLLFITIQGFLRRYLTLSWVNLLRNDESSNFNEATKTPSTFIKTHLEPCMTNLLLFLHRISIPTIQGFLKRYITLSWVNCLRNGELSRWGQIYMEDPVDTRLRAQNLLLKHNFLYLDFV